MAPDCDEKLVELIARKGVMPLVEAWRQFERHDRARDVQNDPRQCEEGHELHGDEPCCCIEDQKMDETGECDSEPSFDPFGCRDGPCLSICPDHTSNNSADYC